jgi:hypothetical protein
MSATREQARETARAILAHGLPDPATEHDVALAVDRVTQQLGEIMVRWIGAAGHVALLQRALAEAAGEFPLLQGLRLDHGKMVDDATDGLHTAPHAVAESMVALLGGYIDLLGRVVGVQMATRLTEQAFPQAEEQPSSEGPLADHRKGE